MSGFAAGLVAFELSAENLVPVEIAKSKSDSCSQPAGNGSALPPLGQPWSSLHSDKTSDCLLASTVLVNRRVPEHRPRRTRNAGKSKGKTNRPPKQEKKWGGT